MSDHTRRLQCSGRRHHPAGVRAPEGDPVHQLFASDRFPHPGLMSMPSTAHQPFPWNDVPVYPSQSAAGSLDIHFHRTGHRRSTRAATSSSVPGSRPGVEFTEVAVPSPDRQTRCWSALTTTFRASPEQPSRRDATQSTDNHNPSCRQRLIHQRGHRRTGHRCR